MSAGVETATTAKKTSTAKENEKAQDRYKWAIVSKEKQIKNILK